jgi:hypothetical protein
MGLGRLQRNPAPFRLVLRIDSWNMKIVYA